MSGYCDIVSDVMSICKIVDVVFRNDILLYDVKSETTQCKHLFLNNYCFNRHFFMMSEPQQHITKRSFLNHNCCQ